MLFNYILCTLIKQKITTVIKYIIRGLLMWLLSNYAIFVFTVFDYFQTQIMLKYLWKFSRIINHVTQYVLNLNILT